MSEPTPQHRDRESKSTLTVLIVDNEQINCELLEAIITTHLPDGQIQVLHAPDAKAAEAIIRTTHINLMFLDEHLLKENGTDFWQRLQADPELQPLLPPTFLATTDNRPDLEELAVSLGMGFIPKPFHFPTLHGILDRHLR